MNVIGKQRVRKRASIREGERKRRPWNSSRGREVYDGGEVYTRD